jgi:hypothetical protein
VRIEKSATFRKPNSKFPVKAELTGSRYCKALGMVATGRTPVLALCRVLLAQSVDPDQALVVYRNSLEALRVRSIRDGAKLTVKEPDRGRPHFASWKAIPPSPVASPMRNSEPPLTGDWLEWPAAPDEAAA